MTRELVLFFILAALSLLALVLLVKLIDPSPPQVLVTYAGEQYRGIVRAFGGG